eukprot:41336-Amphidinium_carterae.1
MASVPSRMPVRERPPSELEPPAKQPRLLAEASAHETLVLNGRDLTLAVANAWDGSGTLGAHRTAWTQRNYLADDFADSDESSTEGCSTSHAALTATRLPDA